jgi:hypothetical protein
MGHCFLIQKSLPMKLLNLHAAAIPANFVCCCIWKEKYRVLLQKKLNHLYFHF